MSVPANEIIYDSDFVKDAHRLPMKLQDKLADLIEILRNNPFDSLLHTKPLSVPLQGIFSFRISRDYRARFKFHPNHTIRILAADRRDKIYKRLRQKMA